MSSGLPDAFDSAMLNYLYAAEHASNHGYTVVVPVVAGLALIAAVLVAWLVRRSPEPEEAGAGG